MFARAGASRVHNRLTWNLTFFLGTQLRGKKCLGFGTDQRVRIPSGNFYTYPDISVACGPEFAPDRRDTLINPTLIIEVLSESTQGFDRGKKLRLYKAL